MTTWTRIDWRGLTSLPSSSSSSSFISIGQTALSSHVVERTASDWLSARVSTPPRIPNARARSRGVGSERERVWESEKERESERALEGKREKICERGTLHPLPRWQNPLTRTLPTPNSQPSSTSHLLLLLCVALAVLILCFSPSLLPSPSPPPPSLSLSLFFRGISQFFLISRFSSLSKFVGTGPTGWYDNTGLWLAVHLVCPVLSITTSAEGIARHGTSVGPNEFGCVSQLAFLPLRINLANFKQYRTNVCLEYSKKSQIRLNINIT